MTNGRDVLPDGAYVVRGGKPPFAKSLRLASRRHPEGPYGFSVQSEAGLAVADLARELPNRRVGFTTVGEIRTMGYDVVRTSGDGFHATLVVPIDWNEADAGQLARSFEDAENLDPKAVR